MNLKVHHHNVKKDKPVSLDSELPLGFGNSRPIKAGARGYVTSHGFEAGILKVKFDLYEGKYDVQFNELSAEKYLRTTLI